MGRFGGRSSEKAGARDMAQDAVPGRGNNSPPSWTQPEKKLGLNFGGGTQPKQEHISGQTGANLPTQYKGGGQPTPAKAKGPPKPKGPSTAGTKEFMHFPPKRGEPVGKAQGAFGGPERTATINSMVGGLTRLRNNWNSMGIIPQGSGQSAEGVKDKSGSVMKGNSVYTRNGVAITPGGTYEPAQGIGGMFKGRRMFRVQKIEMINGQYVAMGENFDPNNNYVERGKTYPVSALRPASRIFSERGEGPSRKQSIF